MVMNDINLLSKEIGQGERLGHWRSASLLYSRKLGTKGICLDGPVSRARTKSYALCRGGAIQLGGWSVAQGPSETRASLYPGSAHRGSAGWPTARPGLRAPFVAASHLFELLGRFFHCCLAAQSMRWVMSLCCFCHFCALTIAFSAAACNERLQHNYRIVKIKTLVVISGGVLFFGLLGKSWVSCLA